jgi:prepilin-type N-terminal cleavage/methylation domain-containing protein
MSIGLISSRRNTVYFGRRVRGYNSERAFMSMTYSRGYTLIELIIAVGLFAVVMTLASGAYIIMIDLTRQAQNKATGIDNLSFALETMTRNIRTGTNYNCGGLGDCVSGASSFSFTDSNGVDVTYRLSGTTIQQNKGGTQSILTEPSVVVSSFMFYVSGTVPLSAGNYSQPHVTIIVSGSVSSGPGKALQSFSVETGATMRGSDL